MTNTPPTVTPAKSRLAYILLAFFLGGLGVHNFYAGYTKRAVLELASCLALIPIIGFLTCGFGFLLYIALWVWIIVEMITVTKDAQGVPFN
jgi:TM2 domain-containing membrane protein YozV